MCSGSGVCLRIPISAIDEHTQFFFAYKENDIHTEQCFRKKKKKNLLFRKCTSDIIKILVEEKSYNRKEREKKNEENVYVEKLQDRKQKKNIDIVWINVCFQVIMHTFVSLILLAIFKLI